MAGKYTGFTLVELSIVLIIVGLIAAGVLVGRDLIHAAQLRSVITDAQKLELAISTFQVKYNALPGDMANAEDVWGSDVNCPDTPSNTIPKVETCNGNGDSLIRNMTIGTQYFEIFRAPQQLSNAGLITGKYSGVQGPGNAVDTLIGINIPKLKNFDAGMLALHNDPNSSGDHIFSGGLRIMVHIGADTLNGWNYKPFLNPQDALYVDSKVDNGKPGSGIWQTYIPGSYPDPDPIPPQPPNKHCATTDDPDTSVYDLSHQEIRCAFVYIIRRD
jgi:prepilin-type N-terminal cleavage/methylation domain-containing protein